VITQGGCERMRWERWLQHGARACPWSYDVIDTTYRTPVEVAALASAWIRRVIGAPHPVDDGVSC
jgi:hypothetical protein